VIAAQRDLFEWTPQSDPAVDNDPALRGEMTQRDKPQFNCATPPLQPPGRVTAGCGGEVGTPQAHSAVWETPAMEGRGTAEVACGSAAGHSAENSAPSTAPELRPYQAAAITAVGGALGRDRTTLVVLPTGTGKTVVFAELARREVAAGGRVLVLAHRTELLDQAARKLQDVAVSAQLERGSLRAGNAQVVVASVQTLHTRRLARFPRDAFQLLVVDEAHHASAATYRAILGYFESAKVLGVTATPDRSDGSALGDVFASCAYRYDLREAIRDQWLVPIRARRIVVDGLDLSSVHTRAGDLAQNELAEVMQREEVLHGIASPLLEQAGDRRAIVFAVDVATSHALADVLNRHREGCARALDGGADDLTRRTTLHEFRLGRFQFLVNCALFTEGFDEPSMACVAVCRPTKSRALYTQMVGRGTRLLGRSYAESIAAGKRDVLLLDFTGNSGRHRLIGPADCLAGAELDAEQAAVVDRMLGAEQLELESVLAAAAAEVAAQRERVKLVATAHYRTHEVDPFLGAFFDRQRKPEKWDSDPATPSQLKALEKAGLADAPGGLTKGEASAMLDAVARRRLAGLATIPMVRLLERLNLDARNMTFDRAAKLIAKARETNTWKPYMYMHEPEFRRGKKS